MGITKRISVQVPEELHAKVKTELDALGVTMNQYIGQILDEHFTMKENGGKGMGENNRILAFQVSEKLFERVKAYLRDHHKLSQKQFIIGLIERELDDYEAKKALENQRADALQGAGDDQVASETEVYDQPDDEYSDEISADAQGEDDDGYSQ